jgi:hypothetical protein
MGAGCPIQNWLRVIQENMRVVRHSDQIQEDLTAIARTSQVHRQGESASDSTAAAGYPQWDDITQRRQYVGGSADRPLRAEASQ